MNIGIVYYNSGNLYSLQKILNDLKCNWSICQSREGMKKYDKIIIPGVGSFYSAMQFFRKEGFDDELKEFALNQNRKILGICLGMQILFNSGKEDKISKGLDLIEGTVVKMTDLGCKEVLPHIGWNSVRYESEINLFKNITNESDFYFSHSFAVSQNDKNLKLAHTHYGINFVSYVNKANIYGCQFHPEKSSKNGLNFLKNFLKI